MRKLIIVLLTLACLLVSGCSNQSITFGGADIYYSDYTNYRIFVRIDNCDLQHEGYANRYSVYDVIAQVMYGMRLYNTELIVEAHTTDEDYELFEIPPQTFLRVSSSEENVTALSPNSTYADYDNVFLYDYVEHYRDYNPVYTTDSQEAWLIYKGLFGGVDLPNKNEVVGKNSKFEFLNKYITCTDIKGTYTVHVSADNSELKTNTIFKAPESNLVVTSYSGNLEADIVQSLSQSRDDSAHLIFSNSLPVFMFEDTEAESFSELITSGDITYIDSRVFDIFIPEEYYDVVTLGE